MVSELLYRAAQVVAEVVWREACEHGFGVASILTHWRVDGASSVEDSTSQN